MTWQPSNGGDLTNDPLVQITQRNATDLHLFVERVTTPVAYTCVLRSNLGIISQDIRVYVTDVPGPPRNLDIQSAGSDGDSVAITWTAPDTDNFSPLTAYYVNVTVDETNSDVMRVSPDITEIYYMAKCKVINVTVTSENDCGNSSAVEAGIDTRYQQCGKFLLCS